MFLKRNILLLFLVCASYLNAQTKIKTMFYNTLNYDSNQESRDKTSHLKTILDDTQPDLFMVCELKNETASNYLFNNAILPFNANFKKATFKTSQSPATGLLQMVYYNSSKLTLESEEVIPTNIRDINHYTFKINTVDVDTNPIRIEVFVTHLKASRGSINMDKRKESINNFIRELDRLPSDSYVLFAGDFNFYTSNEPGFLNLIDDTNSIKIIDPINRLCPSFPEDNVDYFDENNYDSTYFWNNSSFADVHSQSTRNTQVNGDGAGGGMDDRFDFIMMSENFNTSSDLFYISNSYKAVGNNENCYNSYVSNASCNGEFSQNLRNALYYFSDHLPIVMEIETPKNTLSVTKEENFISFVSSNLVENTLIINLKQKIHTLVIYNQLGQQVFGKRNPQKNHLKINIASFAKGLYYIKADNYKPIKFIKI